MKDVTSLQDLPYILAHCGLGVVSKAKSENRFSLIPSNDMRAWQLSTGLPDTNMLLTPPLPAKKSLSERFPKISLSAEFMKKKHHGCT